MSYQGVFRPSARPRPALCSPRGGDPSQWWRVGVPGLSVRRLALRRQSHRTLPTAAAARRKAADLSLPTRQPAQLGPRRHHPAVPATTTANAHLNAVSGVALSAEAAACRCCGSAIPTQPWTTPTTPPLSPSLRLSVCARFIHPKPPPRDVPDLRPPSPIPSPPPNSNRTFEPHEHGRRGLWQRLVQQCRCGDWQPEQHGQQWLHPKLCAWQEVRAVGRGGGSRKTQQGNTRRCTCGVDLGNGRGCVNNCVSTPTLIAVFSHVPQGSRRTAGRCLSLAATRRRSRPCGRLSTTWRLAQTCLSSSPRSSSAWPPSLSRSVAEFPFPGVQQPPSYPLLPSPSSPTPQLRKLAYLYVVRYAEECPDIALLSISSFQKGLKVSRRLCPSLHLPPSHPHSPTPSSSLPQQDPNQLIRASALRVLSSIRVADIVPVMLIAVKEVCMLAIRLPLLPSCLCPPH